MSSKTCFIQKFVAIGFWIFPLFYSVFSVDDGNFKVEYRSPSQSQSQNNISSNTASQTCYNENPCVPTLKDMLNKETNNSHIEKNNPIEDNLWLIDEMEKNGVNKFEGLKIDYLLGNYSEEMIRSYAYKNGIYIENKKSIENKKLNIQQKSLTP